MKHFFSLIALLLSCSTVAMAQSSSTQALTNRYGMKLEQGTDGTFALKYQKKVARILDLEQVPDLLTPYYYSADRISSRDYKKAETTEYVYKQHDGYDLSIAVDSYPSDTPTPVVFYIHGGGWARGDNSASRSLSKYLAQQKGITGVRVEYTLAPQNGASVEVSIQDVLDAVQYVKDHAAQLNIDPDHIGFLGSSAGAHLAACAALKTEGARVLVGNSGIYNLTTAAITTRAKDPERIAYFGGLEHRVLADASPVYMIPKRTRLAVQLYCGTGDTTVEYTQSEEFARELKRHKAQIVDLQIYPYYDHGLNSKGSDKMEEIFFKTVDFIDQHIR